MSADPPSAGDPKQPPPRAPRPPISEMSPSEASQAAAYADAAADFADATSAPSHQGFRSRDELPSGSTIGPYQVIERIGAGGMGVVYRAEQRTPVRRIVALKLIKLGMDTDRVVARFESERQALAMMNHPNVARVFDAGATETGRPFFAMEFVAGEPITTYCDKHRLSINERLSIFRKVCDAVQHAHSKGIIHRDLKPSNVLVSLQDNDEPMPKVIDFGVAKATQQRLTEHTLFTETGQLIGTPEYMSPEQAERSGLDIDTRSDVYSLGVMLYELLTGTLPFESKSLRGVAYGEIQRIIRDVEPKSPSTRLSSLGNDAAEIARRRQMVDAAVLRKQLRGDLDWIVMRAMEKDRTRRYSTPADLAADLARHLRYEPVFAGPPSTMYRVQRFARRHRAAVATGAVIVVLLIAGVAATAWQAVRATRAEHEAIAQRDRAEADRREAEAQRQLAERNRMRADAMAENLRDMVMQQLTNYYDQLREIPGTAKARRAMLDMFRAQLEKTFLNGEADPKSRITLVRLYRQLGDLQGNPDVFINLGLLDDARRSYQDALRLLESLPPAMQDKGTTTEKAILHCQIGTVLGAKGQLEDGLGELQQGIELFRSPAAGGADLNAQSLALTYRKVAGMQAQLDRPRATADAYLSALEYQQRVKARPDEDPKRVAEASKREIAWLHGVITRSLVAAGDPAAAVPHRKAAKDGYREITKVAPSEPSQLRQFSLNLSELGQLLIDDGEFEAARERFTRALEIDSRLSKADPDNVMALDDVRSDHESLAQVYVALKDFDAAVDAATRARDVASDMLKRSPDNANFRAAFASTLANLGNLHAQRAVSGKSESDWTAATDAFRRAVSELESMRTAGLLADVHAELLATCRTKLADCEARRFIDPTSEPATQPATQPATNPDR